MHDISILNAIIRTVPQWYVAEDSENDYSLSFSGKIVNFSSHRPLTSKLLALLDYAQSSIPRWQSVLPRIVTTGVLAKIGEDLAMHWLALEDASIDWHKWTAYAEEMRLRTHENVRIERNLIISDGVGSQDITDTRVQNVLDTLTARPQVYLRVDKDLRFLDYDEILWREVRDSTEYKFAPEFLRPVTSMLNAGDFCAHLSTRGDILVAGRLGMLTSCRKGQWYVYDVEALRDCIMTIIGDYHVASHIFEVLFDLSYRRHGALLIFDPARQVIQHIANPEAIIDGVLADSQCDAAHKMLSPRIRGIHMGETRHSARKKRLFLEVAEVDGALIFDTQQVLAFGAMVEFHPSVRRFHGARGAAAQSALLWGGHAFKVSADGDITILFLDPKTSTRSELRFM